MKITKLKLENFKQHRVGNYDFDGTLIAVVGPNGSGKSNLLGAIEFAMTGGQSDTKKADLLSWGASTGFVEVAFEHQGRKGKIRRELHSAAVTLRYGDLTVTGATKVAEALRDHLDLDKDLMKQAVFVQQAEVDSILFTDAKVRELSFQRLMGIGDAAKIHRVLGDVISELDTQQDYAGQLNDSKVQHAEMRDRLNALRSQVTAAQGRMSEAPAAADLKNMRDTLPATVTAIERALESRTSVQQAEAALRSAEEVVAQLSATPISDDVENYDALLVKLHAERQALAQHVRADADWRKAGEAIIALGSMPHAPESLTAAQQEYEALSARLHELRGKYKLHDDLRKTIVLAGSVSECPVCGSPIADAEALTERLTSILSSLTEAGTCLSTSANTSKASLDKMNAEQTAFVEAYKSAVAVYNQAKLRLDSNPKPETAKSVEDYDTEIQLTTAKRQELLGRAAAYTRAAGAVDASKTALERAVAACAAAEGALGAWGVAKDKSSEAFSADIAGYTAQYNAATEYLRIRSELDVELARLGGTVSELESAIAALERTIATLEFKQGTQASHSAALATLRRTRDWFHYTNGPHEISSSVLGQLNDDVNRFLSQFTAPFTVSPSDESVGFTCTFTDGRTIREGDPPDAKVLSGGEKIQLAVAFRFAVYCMFASKLGLLSLDEPTVYMDDTNVGRFCDLLTQVKQIASAMDLQIFIATHERSVIPFCDGVIDLLTTKG